MLKLEFPWFVRVTLWAALVDPSDNTENTRALLDKLTLAPVPLPCKVTVCDPPAALSLSTSDAVRVPVAVGANFTANVQLPFAATVLPQVLVCVKSPVTEMELMLRATGLRFCT